MHPVERERAGDLAASVSRTLFLQAAGLHLRAGVGAPPTIVFVAALLWPQAPRTGLIAWAAAAMAWNVVTCSVCWRPARTGQVRAGDERRLVAGMAVAGVIWGGVAIVALPVDPRWQGLVAVFVFGFIASNAIFAAPHRAAFFAFHVGVVASATVGFLRVGPGFPWVLAGALAYGGAFAVFLHAATHAADRRAATEALRNQRLAAEIDRERGQLTRANSALARLKDDFAHRASHDPLTGLANRALFAEHLERAVAIARREGRVCAVLFLDLDRFKVVNDSLGHALGDELLRLVARRVEPLLRDGDVFARMGGDEFTVLLPLLHNPDEALRIADRVLDVFADPFVLDSRSIRISPSIGVAHDADGTDSAEDLLRHADAALYRAKDLGRRRVEVFDAGFRAQLARRVDEEQRIRTAFEHREITAWYQPTVDLVTGAIVGAEALARWIHPEHGPIPAGAFVPMAEDCGLEADLSKLVWRSTLRLRASLVGVVPEDFRIRLNIHPREISDEQLQNVLDALAFWGCPADGIGVEVTERAVIADLDQTMTVLAATRQAGLTVELDDFGTGHSSLTLVTRLPVDGLKIDRSFVIALESSASARAVVAATVELAGRLDHDVTAEGVETPSQAALLRAMGVRYAQGYLWSPAVPGEELCRWLVDGPPWLPARRTADLTGSRPLAT